MFTGLSSVKSYNGSPQRKTFFLTLTFLLLAGLLTGVFGQGETCELAVTVSPGSYTANGPSSGAGAINSCFPISGEAINADWYVYEATANGTISISSCYGGADTRLSIFTGSCGSLICYAASDDACAMTITGSAYASEISDLAVAEGESYYIQWDSRWSGLGFNWSFTFTAGTNVPTNDDCVNATPMQISPYGECASYSVTGNTAGADDSQGSPSCDLGGGPWPDVFYSFNSSSYANLVLTFTQGTIGDRVVEVFEECGGESILCGVGFEIVELSVTPNTDYIIRVSSNINYGSAGSFNLCLSSSELPPCSNPEITYYAYASGGDLSVPIDGCIDEGTPYNIAVYITDEYGNSSYNLSFNGGESFLYTTGNGAAIGLGPWTTSLPVTITATGVENFNCSTTVIFEPPICYSSSDECSTPTPLPLNGEPLVSTNTDATPSVGLSIDCGAGDSSVDNDVWFSFEAPSSGIVTIETFAGTNTDTQMQIFDACGGSVIACNDDKYGSDYMSKIILLCDSYIPGEVYLVQVDGWNGASGSFTISATSTPCPAPVNDECADAINIPVDGSLVEATNSGATPSDGVTIDCGSGVTNTNDVWFSFEAPSTGILTIETFAGTNENTLMQIFDACGGSVIACNNDKAGLNGDYMSRVILPCDAYIPGEVYLVQIDGWYGASGSFTISATSTPCPAPVNDECADAINIPVDGSLVEATNSGATGSDGAYINCESGVFNVYKDVWFSFEAPSSGIVTIETFAGTFVNSQMQIFDACGGTIIACNDDKDWINDDFMSRVILPCDAYIPGEVYLVHIDGWYGASGSFTISATSTPCPAPVNDECADAINIPVDGGVVEGTNLGATSSDGITIGCGAGDLSVHNDVWFSFEAPSSGILTIETFAGTNVDTQMQIFDACGGFVRACNDDKDGANGDYMSKITLPCHAYVPGEVYFVQVDGWNGASGSFTISVTSTPCPDPPANNECAGATNIPVDGGAFEATNFGATGDLDILIECLNIEGEPVPDEDAYARKDVWYSFVAPETGIITIETFSITVLDTQLQIFEECGGTVIGCNDDKDLGNGNYMSKVILDCSSYIPGHTYYIQVDSWAPGYFGYDGGSTFTISVSTESCPAPANDSCMDAEVVVCGATYPGTTYSATFDADQEFCDVFAPGSENGGVWYEYTPTEDGSVKIELQNAAFDYSVFLYSGSCNSLSCEMGHFSGYSSSITADLLNGNTYYIYVSGASLGENGNFDLSISCLNPPANDDCSNAENLVCGGTYSGNTLSAGSYDDQSFCGSGPTPVDNLNGGVWYSYSPAEDGTALFSISNSDFNNQIFLYAGSCGSLVCIDGNNDGPEGDDSDDAQIEASVEGGQMYYLYVTGVFSERGNFDLNIVCNYCPDLDLHIGDSCDDGDPLTFNDVITENCLCAGVPECTNPELTLTPYPVGGSPYQPIFCIAEDSLYYVAFFVNEDYGNTHYTLTLDNGSSFLWDATEGGIGIGPFQGGSPVEYTVTGVENTTCSYSGTVDLVICQGPPANDECVDAVAIPVDGAPVEGTNSEATPSPDVSVGCGVFNDTDVQNDVWFSFVAPSSGILTIETFAGTMFDTQMQIFDACGGSIIACNDDKDFDNDDYMSKITLSCDSYTPGEIYLVQVDGWDGASGTFTISATSSPCPAPPNDEACDATPIGCSDILSQSLAYATVSIDDDCLGDAADIWFSFTSDGSQILTIAETSSFDATVQLFEGNDCSNLSEVGSCADAAESFTVTEPGTYYFRVRPTHASGESEEAVVSLTCEDYDCPDLNANIGDDCDDNDPSTINDMIVTGCTCEGTSIAYGTIAGTVSGWNNACEPKDIFISIVNFSTGETTNNIPGTLQPDGSFTLDNPAEIVPGTYGVLVKVDGALAERLDNMVINPGLNTVVSPPVTKGDLNNDNVINIADISQFTSMFGSALGDPNFDAKADFNCDGVINISDVSVISNNFGEEGGLLPS